MQQITYDFRGCGHSVHLLMNDIWGGFVRSFFSTQITDPSDVECPMHGNAWPMTDDIVGFEIRYRGQGAVDEYYRKFLRSKRKKMLK